MATPDPGTDPPAGRSNSGSIKDGARGTSGVQGGATVGSAGIPRRPSALPRMVEAEAGLARSARSGPLPLVGTRSCSSEGGASPSWPAATFLPPRKPRAESVPRFVHYPGSKYRVPPPISRSGTIDPLRPVEDTSLKVYKSTVNCNMVVSGSSCASDVPVRSIGHKRAAPVPLPFNLEDDIEPELEMSGVQTFGRAGGILREPLMIDLNMAPDVEESTERSVHSSFGNGQQRIRYIGSKNDGRSNDSFGILDSLEQSGSNYDDATNVAARKPDPNKTSKDNPASSAGANIGENVAASAVPNSGSEGSPTILHPTRNRTYEGPNCRPKVPGRKSALELAMMKFANRTTEYIIYPHVGLEFDCFREAFDYYNLYSWESGFGIKIGKTRTSVSQKAKSSENDESYVLSVELHCCCSGKPPRKVTVTSRTACPALLRLHRTEDHGWVVTEHRAEHNHPLSETCGEKRQWKSHKHIDNHTRELIRILRENNIGLTKIYSVLGDFFGSMQNVPTNKRSLRALCQRISREQAEDDIKKTLKLFADFRESDPGFVYTIEPDEENRIKSLMWTNSRSRMQYAHFGDVITFDTTYRTNLYDMPFGMFIGVNNHFQSILLGAVLLTEETIESFKWAFKEFVSLMGGKRPQTILTDQCRAMEVAISEVWPETAHRWCKWHVLRRVRECIGPKYTDNKEFRDRFHMMLNEMLTEEEFKKAWSELLAEYGMTLNPFLKQIYDTKEMWVSCYFRGIFCAKMTTTQRSESANHMLKGLVPPGSSIHHFVQQYAKLQHTIDDAENFEEKRTKLNTRNLSLGGPLVMHASKIYTFKVYEMFCKLKSESEEYYVTDSSKPGEYVVEHYNLERVQRWCKGVYVVKVENDKSMFNCECGMFEHFGLPCCHAIRVMISIGLKSIPDKMILQRWTKNARLILPEHLAHYGKPNPALLAKTFRHSALFIAALELVNLGDSNVQCFHIAMACIMEAKEKLAELSKDKDGLGLADRQAEDNHSRQQQSLAAASSSSNAATVDKFPLRVPLKKRERGRPTNARDRPSYENCSKRPKFCKQCRSGEHRSDRCPHRDPASRKPRAPPTCRGCGISGHTIAGCGAVSSVAAVAEII